MPPSISLPLLRRNGWPAAPFLSRTSCCDPLSTHTGVVAEELADSDPHNEIDEKLFFGRCLRLAKQWALQHRIASEESISVEMFSTALKMARHRGLLDGDPSNAGEKRKQLVRELTELQCAIESLAAMGNAPTPVELQ